MTRRVSICIFSFFILIVSINTVYGQENPVVLGNVTPLTGQITIFPQKSVIATGENDSITPYGDLTGGKSPYMWVWYMLPSDSQQWEMVANGEIQPNQDQDYSFIPDDNTTGIVKFQFVVFDSSSQSDHSNIVTVKVVKGSQYINSTKNQIKVITQQVQIVKAQPREYTIFEGIIAVIIVFFGSIYGWKIFGVYMTKPKPPKPRSEELMNMLQNSKFASDFIKKVVERKELYPFLEKLREAFEEKKRSKPHDWGNQT